MQRRADSQPAQTTRREQRSTLVHRPSSVARRCCAPRLTAGHNQPPRLSAAQDPLRRTLARTLSCVLCVQPNEQGLAAGRRFGRAGPGLQRYSSRSPHASAASRADCYKRLLERIAKWLSSGAQEATSGREMCAALRIISLSRHSRAPPRNPNSSSALDQPHDAAPRTPCLRCLTGALLSMRANESRLSCGPRARHGERMHSNAQRADRQLQALVRRQQQHPLQRRDIRVK